MWGHEGLSLPYIRFRAALGLDGFRLWRDRRARVAENAPAEPLRVRGGHSGRGRRRQLSALWRHRRAAADRAPKPLCSSSEPLIAIVKSADLRKGDDLALARRL